MTNGGGASVLAADTLADLRGSLARLEQKTMDALDAVLPPTWSHGNPVDIVGDASPERYAAAVSTVMKDKNADAVLVMNVPTALGSSVGAAKATVDAVKAARKAGPAKPVIATWLAPSTAEEVKPLFREAKIPDFATPSAAIRGITQLARYGAAQAELMQTPPALPADMHFDAAAVEASIARVLQEGRNLMTEPEAKSVLKAYGIPTVPTRVALTPEDAAAAAAELLRSYSSVVVKILSPDITHKSDVGGVRLDLTSAEEVGRVARQMLAEIKALRPDADLRGVTVQPKVRRRDAYELLLGITPDPAFGPVVLFGTGGTAVEAIGDTAMSLTPLDLKLAPDLVESTRVYQLLKGFRDKQAVDLPGLALCLVKLSSLAVQHPAIRELDINPLLASEKGLLALDARIRVEDPAVCPAVPPAIRPYPVQWEKKERLLNGQEILIRPIRPDDEHYYIDLMTKMTPEDIRLRMFMPVREFSHQFFARMTQIDYAREMAFIALLPNHSSGDGMIGAVRFFADPDYEKAEYAVMVRSNLKGVGLGWVLMRHLIRYAKSEGLKSLYGTVLKENATMIQMCEELGFQAKRDPDDPMLYAVTLDLNCEAVNSLLAQPG